MGPGEGMHGDIRDLSKYKYIRGSVLFSDVASDANMSMSSFKRSRISGHLCVVSVSIRIRYFVAGLREVFTFVTSHLGP